MAIDIGAEATDRGYAYSAGRTVIAKDNPANASGTITSVEIWANTDMTNCRVGTFYTTNGDRLKCRDSATIGAVTAGSKQTFTEDSGGSPLAITVETGDYIGFYETPGKIEWDIAGFLGMWYVVSEFIDPGDETDYSLAAGDTISLKGTGEEEAPPVGIGAFSQRLNPFGINIYSGGRG